MMDHAVEQFAIFLCSSTRIAGGGQSGDGGTPAQGWIGHVRVEKEHKDKGGPQKATDVAALELIFALPAERVLSQHAQRDHK